MKLLIAIVQDKDAHLLGEMSLHAKYSRNSFINNRWILRAGITFIGIEERVQEALDIIKENCQSRGTNDCAN